tara:strand:+ start:4330 stop:5544 length:1215 start_codon:yes stop_codon:yes gene_type:complete
MSRLIDSFEQILDGSGDPLALGLLDFFVSGSSSTRKKTYADAAETIENTNPVVVGGDGRCPNVFGTGTYNVILRTSADVQLLARDPVGGSDSLTFGADWVASTSYSATDQVRDDGNYWQSVTNLNQGNQPSLNDGSNWLKTDFLNITVNTLAIAANATAIALKYDKTGGALTGQATSTAGDFNLVVNTALSDAAATLTAAQLIGGEFTITPTVSRIQTLDTAANIISSLSGSQDGSNFTFTVVNLAAFDVTIATAAGVTLVGNMVVNNGNALFRVRRLSASTVSVTRLETISIFTKEYESAQQTITNAGLLTLTHGLSVKPKVLDFYLVCTAADVGYSIGDQIQANLNSTTSSTNRYNTYYVTSTQIFLRFADNVQPFITGNKSSGAAVGADTLKWKLVVRAYA